MLTTKNKSRSYQRDIDYPDDELSSSFKTFDLGASTALLCEGFELVSVDKSYPRRSQFIFKRDDRIEATANEYFSDRLQVRARSFFDHLKALKNKLYSD